MTTELENLDFEVNPYDWCVANKEENGFQCTVTWHVDDLKISSKSKDMVNNLITKLNTQYGKIKPLTVSRGLVHDYLGMMLYYSKPRTVQMSMLKYIKNLLEEVPEDMKGEAITPATDHLFNVDPAATKLDEPQKEMFYHLVAKLLYLSQAHVLTFK